MGSGVSFPGEKRPVRKAYYSVSSVEVHNAWRYNSTPQYAFMARCLVKFKDNFYHTFYLISSDGTIFYRRHTIRSVIYLVIPV